MLGSTTSVTSVILQGGFACSEARPGLGLEIPTWEFPQMTPPDSAGASAVLGSGCSSGVPSGKEGKASQGDQGTWRKSRRNEEVIKNWNAVQLGVG